MLSIQTSCLRSLIPANKFIMEPPSVITLMANFVSLTDNLYRGVRFIRRSYVDPRTDGLYVRLITEQARYAEWKRRMGIEKLEDITALLGKIPENARESLKIILAPMGKYLRESEELFKKYGFENFDGPPRLKDKLKCIDFLNHGEWELTNLLNTLKHCNDGLLTIAPPAPGYHVSLPNNDLILEMSQPTQQSQNREHSQFRQTRSRSQHAQLSHPIGQKQISPICDDIASKQNDSRGAKVFYPVIELLYSTSLGVLRVAAVRYPIHKPSLEGALYRLSLWGSGMFQGLITIDQALNQKSGSVELLRNNIAGALAEIAITLEYILSILGEPTDSILVLRLKSIFSIDEISHFPLDDEPSEYDQDSGDDQSVLLERCTRELSELIECLFWTLPTIEMVFKTVLARQTQNPALDERKMLLRNSESDISLSNIKSEPIRKLLKIDLELISTMREILKDTYHAIYMEQGEPALEPAQLYKDLGEESAQVKYWTSKLAEDNHDITEETQAAMTLNLARIASAFNARYKPSDLKKEPLTKDEIRKMIRRCLPDTSDDRIEEGALLSEQRFMIGDGNTISAALYVLKSSNVELRRLAGSTTPGMSYQKDFLLSEKEEEREAHSEQPQYWVALEAVD